MTKNNGMSKRDKLALLSLENSLRPDPENPNRNRGGQPGNQNAAKSCIYANRFLNEEELQFFDDALADFIADFNLKMRVDIMQAKAAILYHIKTLRALEEDDQSALWLDQMFRSHLKGLKATRERRKDLETPTQKLSPAEAAIMLLDDYRSSGRLAELEAEEAAERNR